MEELQSTKLLFFSDTSTKKKFALKMSLGRRGGKNKESQMPKNGGGGYQSGKLSPRANMVDHDDDNIAFLKQQGKRDSIKGKQSGLRDVKSRKKKMERNSLFAFL